MTDTHDVRQLTTLGREIESGSFRIIDEEVGDHDLPLDHWQIVRRVIHSTADFEYKELVKIHPQAVLSGTTALHQGCNIIVDVNMIASGLSAERLKQFGCSVYSYIADDDVIRDAKAHNSTRAIFSMRKAHRLGQLDGSIIAIGNAPTALIEVARLVREEGLKPAVVIGVPVGFVSAAESKDDIAGSGCPYIITSGRKGGSPIAVSVIHALMYLAAGVRQ
jgi:precorrin-8X/cobalt-precorrin-8 methylmutase